jgi:hypothetical protein
MLSASSAEYVFDSKICTIHIIRVCMYTYSNGNGFRFRFRLVYVNWTSIDKNEEKKTTQILNMIINKWRNN